MAGTTAAEANRSRPAGRMRCAATMPVRRRRVRAGSSRARSPRRCPPGRAVPNDGWGVARSDARESVARTDKNGTRPTAYLPARVRTCGARRDKHDGEEDAQVHENDAPAGVEPRDRGDGPTSTGTPPTRRSTRAGLTTMAGSIEALPREDRRDRISLLDPAREYPANRLFECRLGISRQSMADQPASTCSTIRRSAWPGPLRSAVPRMDKYGEWDEAAESLQRVVAAEVTTPRGRGRGRRRAACSSRHRTWRRRPRGWPSSRRGAP